VSVGPVHVATWQDVLGAWHGQVIARVRNGGTDRIELRAAEARATVRAGDRVVYRGAFDAAVRPVLAAGEEGYLVVGFPLPAGAREPTVEVVAAAGPVTDMRELAVSDADVTPEPGRVVVVGTAENGTSETVRDGVVPPVAVAADGTPQAPIVDRASLGRLRAGESRTFRASEPVAPPIEPADVDELVISAWGRVAP
jgi:hypothetical protein